MQPLDLEWPSHTHAGVTYWLRPPACARDVLEVEVLVMARLIEREVAAHDLAHLIRWCAAHIVDATCGWVGLTDAGRREHLDEAMGLTSLLALKDAIVEAASMPQKTLDAVRDYHHVTHSGGCECPKCKDPERYQATRETARAALDAACRFKDLKGHHVRTVALCRGLQSADPLGAPWWAYQLEAARVEGEALGRLDQRERADTKDRVRTRLKEAGLWKGRRR